MSTVPITRGLMSRSPAKLLDRPADDGNPVGSFRTSCIRFAVLTSVASKVTTTAFQLLAITIAVRALVSALGVTSCALPVILLRRFRVLQS
jgi:hypothetical protein